MTGTTERSKYDISQCYSYVYNNRMDDSVRPVRLRKVALGYHFAENKQSEFQFDLTLSYKLAAVIKTYSEAKPTLVVYTVFD